MGNNKLIVVFYFAVISVVGFSVSSMATTYTVGDYSGWDISSDLDSWAAAKTFKVGDVLLFQYSQSHSVSELTKEKFNACNISNPLNSSSNGNSTIPLSTVGVRYFACGNRLHCLGGMKLQVTTISDKANEVGAPSPLPDPSTRNSNNNNNNNNNNLTPIPTSGGSAHGGIYSLVLACFTTIMATVLLSFVD